MFWLRLLSSATSTLSVAPDSAGAAAGAAAAARRRPTCASTSRNLSGVTGLASVACTTPLSAAGADRAGDGEAVDGRAAVLDERDVEHAVARHQLDRILRRHRRGRRAPKLRLHGEDA